MESTSCTNPNGARRSFIGGSDARIMMGADEGAPFPLWREKRGEIEPQDLSGNLIVQLGLMTTLFIGIGTNATPAGPPCAWMISPRTSATFGF